ncbi:uncharacterized protein EAF01_002900 [Botrytis porri]|uniref:uncharacterized protein n=1 Tax=Botrytis porri TaxID=87229 RepID=UPI001900A846|nr:uncharacterized protein EAF01_002900 [Botrytis porri]KAF7911393.1 hypothetical protein EAF01_002900 [Botrytis porri]
MVTGRRTGNPEESMGLPKAGARWMARRARIIILLGLEKISRLTAGKELGEVKGSRGDVYVGVGSIFGDDESLMCGLVASSLRD